MTDNVQQQQTFSLLFCDNNEFLSVKNEIVKIKAKDHNEAMDIFLDDYEDDMINKTIMTFCYEESAAKYGYEYVIVNQRCK